ncbi:clostripain-related cysteine peptidase [Pusillimonas noertemannii]|uniref:clostripain-related cysteine peptidase n=1 Tax=Pusillimonas noertemannii TaxID=305977 RepID=UPI00333E564C
MHFKSTVHIHPPSPWSRWLLLPLLALMLLLTACGGSGDSSKSDDQARATVLVYVVGSDLEDEADMATGNLEEMMKVGSSQDVNIIVETGGADKDGWRTVKRQKVLKGSMEVIADEGVQRMTDPDNLQKFIEWGVEAYPAKSYHLVFWNHGGGPLGGFGGDRNFPGTGTMSMPQIVQALEGAKQSTGATFDLVGFDACLMASAEVAYMLSPYAHYLVASQEIEPGPGWDWTSYLNHVVGDSGSTAVSAGKVIADAYMAKTASLQSNFATLSVTDLSKSAALIESVDVIARAIVEKLNTGTAAQQYSAWADLAYVRRVTHDFQTSWMFGNMFDLVDLTDFVTKAPVGMFDYTPEQVEAVQIAMNEAIVYNRHGKELHAASGQTLYMPLVSAQPEYGAAHLRLHSALDIPQGLKDLVRRYIELAASPDLPKPSLGTLKVTGDTAYAQLNNPGFAALEYANLWNNANINIPRHLAVKPLDGSVPAGVGQDDKAYLAARPYDGWFRLPSAVGDSVLVSVLPDDTPRMAAGYAMYTVPVFAVDEDEDNEPGGRINGESGVLLVEYNEDDATAAKTYRVVGFLAGNGSSPLASRADPSVLKQGQKFHPLVLTDGEWQPDLSRTIIGFDAGDDDTPQDQWWQLQPATSHELCGNHCGFSFGIVDYQGKMSM